jgi:predicted flap endonuclease-1-like 5' DNA nuclease/chromosome segregation ATPase
MGSSQDRVHRLEIELSDREAAHRAMIQQLERSLAERDQRIKKFDSQAATQAQEVQEAQQACHAAEQAQEVLKEEIRVLREHIAQLNEGLPARERLLAEAKEQVKELESMRSRVHQLEVELSDREAAHRGALQQLEQVLTERDQRISEFDSLAAAQADEVRDALETCRIAEQTREVQKEEIRVLREQIAQLNEGLADRDRLRTQLKKLETVQSRVHQLEVELSDREAAHRGTIKQLEQALTERDRRISKFDSQAATQTQELQEAQQACHAAEQAQEVLKEEIRVLREQIAQLNEGLADRDHLRVRMEKLESAQDRVHQLEVELSDREAAHRGALQQLEQVLTERDQRISEFDSLAAAQADEVRDAQQAHQAAQQAQEVLKEEIRVLREHITQLNEGLADRDRLRAQVAKLDSTQDRVHQLEVELSDREAAHRGTLQQLERSLAERDKRIEKLVPITHFIREKESEIKEWENKFTRTVRDHEGQVTKLQAQCAAQDQLREKHRLAERNLHERDEQIISLQRQLHDLETARQQLATEVQRIPEKDEQISRLRKRLREMQAELRAETTPSAKGSTIAKMNPIAKAAPSAHPAPSTKAAQSTIGPRQGRQNGAGQHSHVDQAKSSVAPNTKAEPINKAVPSAKASHDAKPAPNTKPAPSTNAAPANVVSHQGRQNGAGKNSHVAQPKSGNGKDIQKDDLQKINGIGPVFAQTLNKLGTYTFIQIARWKPEDIEKISKRLETDPERIKRENWIADAKKLHYKKYGERL